MTRYIPRDGWVEGINLPGFSNRYLYCTPTSVYVMAGDRPLLRLAEKRRLLGTRQRPNRSKKPSLISSG